MAKRRMPHSCPVCGAGFLRRRKVAEHLANRDGQACRRVLTNDPANLLPAWAGKHTPVGLRTLVVRGSLYVVRDRRKRFTVYGITPTGEQYALACRQSRKAADGYCLELEGRA